MVNMVRQVGQMYDTSARAESAAWACGLHIAEGCGLSMRMKAGYGWDL
jgi:hypothetical protein